MSKAGAMLMLVTSMALTGANVPLAKMLSASLSADVLLVLRFAIAGAVLAILAAREGGPRLSSLSAPDWGRIAVLALMGSVLFTWAVLEGVQRTSGVTAGIILSALPAVVALIGALLGARLQRGEMAMVGLAVAGLVLVQAHGAAASSAGVADTLAGNLLIGAAVVCEAAFVIVAPSVSRKMRPLRLALAVSLVSLAACLPFGATGLARLEIGQVPLQVWGMLAWYALTASVLCTVLWYRGAAHVEPWAAGLATAVLPVAAMAVSVAVLGEPLTGAQLAGAVLVVGAIVAGMLAQRRTG